ncbi:MAG: molybdopterin-dependent oxidoreductase, partial [Acidobacteriota bacterium]
MKHISACTVDCPDACGLLVEKRADGGIAISGNPDHPFTAGFTCAKTKSFLRRLNSPNRITHPLLKTGEGWKRISWDEALDLCAKKIRECSSEPASVLHIRGEGVKGVMGPAIDLFFERIGASTVRGSLCDNTGITACIEDFGSLESNDVFDL